MAFCRSLTCRSPDSWGALAFAELEALTWGEIKGYDLRHLRWRAKQPMAERDGVLSIGCAYPDLLMSESSDSAGSPCRRMIPSGPPKNSNRPLSRSRFLFRRARFC